MQSVFHSARMVRSISAGCRFFYCSGLAGARLGSRLSASRFQHIVDEEIVDERACNSTYDGTHDRHPEIVANARKGHLAPAGQPGEQPGTEVPGGVDRVPGICAE